MIDPDKWPLYLWFLSGIGAIFIGPVMKFFSMGRSSDAPVSFGTIVTLYGLITMIIFIVMAINSVGGPEAFYEKFIK